MKAAKTSKKKGTMNWGANTAFLLQLGEQAKELGGQLPPSLYVKRGPAMKVRVILIVDFTNTPNYTNTIFERLLLRIIVNNLCP